MVANMLCPRLVWVAAASPSGEPLHGFRPKYAGYIFGVPWLRAIKNPAVGWGGLGPMRRTKQFTRHYDAHVGLYASMSWASGTSHARNPLVRLFSQATDYGAADHTCHVCSTWLRKLMGVEELTDVVAVSQARATARSMWGDPYCCCICCGDNSPSFDEDEEEAGSEPEDAYPTGSESAAWVRNLCGVKVLAFRS